MQKQKIDELVEKSKLILDEKQDEKTIDFVVLAGEKKEIAISQYIEKLLKDSNGREVCFLWMNTSEKNSCERIFQDLKKEFKGFPSCYLFEQEFFGSRQTILGNEVVIADWNKLSRKDSRTGEWKNALMKSSEKINFRELVKNTKNENTKIVMIIDKNYFDKKSERAVELKNIIDADLTFKISTV